MLGQLRQGSTRRLNRHLQRDNRAKFEIEFSYTGYEDTSYPLLNLNETTVYFDALPVEKVQKMTNLKKISISISGLPGDTYATADAYIEIFGVYFPRVHNIHFINLYNVGGGAAVESIPYLEVNLERLYYTPTLESVNIPYITILGEENNAYYVKANYEGEATIGTIDGTASIFKFDRAATGHLVLRTTNNRKLQEDELKNLSVKIQIE